MEQALDLIAYGCMGYCIGRWFGAWLRKRVESMNNRL